MSNRVPHIRRPCSYGDYERRERNEQLKFLTFDKYEPLWSARGRPFFEKWFRRLMERRFSFAPSYSSLRVVAVSVAHGWSASSWYGWEVCNNPLDAGRCLKWWSIVSLFAGVACRLSLKWWGNLFLPFY